MDFSLNRSFALIVLTLFWTGGGGQKDLPQVNSAIWCLTKMKLGRNTV